MRWLVLASALAALTAAPLVRTEALAGPPRLVVLLVVDQLRADYAGRFGHQWSAGLARLRERGAWFERAAYPYANTVTCAGHASLSTGTAPSRHGLVLNEWWDRERGALVSCTGDPEVRNIGHGGVPAGGDSAWRLRAPTLADELRAQLPRPPRVVAISAKARSAIMLAGRTADLVLWFDERTGIWTTSSAYTSQPIPFVDAFVRARPVEADTGRLWTPTLPLEAYLFDDDASAERPLDGGTVTFPHAIVAGPKTASAPFGAWQHSPFADEYLAKLARRAVDELALGQRDTVDYLAVSFSATDEVGHRFGPQSVEVQDVLVRLDATLGRLLDHLDSRVGEGRYLVAMSSDHGVAPIPETLTGRGIAAGRIRAADVEATVDRVLSEAIGPGRYAARAQYSDLYLMPGVYDAIRSRRDVVDRLRMALRGLPGLREVYIADELDGRAAAGDETAQALSRSHFEGRSGDLLLVPDPYWFHVRTTGDATTHGTAAAYDRAVPVVLMGPGIRPGSYRQDASPLDVVPTLAFLSGITMADAQGRVLVEALEPGASPPAPADADSGPR